MAKMTLDEAHRILKDETNRDLREQASRALVEMASFEQSAFFHFLAEHSGQKNLYGSDGRADVGSRYFQCAANDEMLKARNKKLSDTGEVTPGSLERAFAELSAEDSLAPLPRSSDPTKKDGGEHLREAGQRTMFASQKHEMARARFDENTRPIVPYTRNQLLELAGQVRGVPGDIARFKAIVSKWGSPAINKILQSE